MNDIESKMQEYGQFEQYKIEVEKEFIHQYKGKINENIKLCGKDKTSKEVKELKKQLKAAHKKLKVKENEYEMLKSAFDPVKSLPIITRIIDDEEFM